MKERLNNLYGLESALIERTSVGAGSDTYFVTSCAETEKSMRSLIGQQPASILWYGKLYARMFTLDRPAKMGRLIWMNLPATCRSIGSLRL